jgi:hypothetical protein
MKTILLLPVFLFFLQGAWSQKIQRIPAVTQNDIQEFYQEASKVAAEKERAIPALLQHRNRANTSMIQNSKHASVARYSNVIIKGYKLADDVKAAGTYMNSRQYTMYLRKLASLLQQLDRIMANDPAMAGDPKPGTLGECWKSCDDAVGGGFGGGKGWNRFTCKSGCIITKLPPGS